VLQRFIYSNKWIVCCNKWTIFEINYNFFVYLVDKMSEVGQTTNAKYFVVSSSNQSYISCQCKVCHPKHDYFLIMLRNWQILLRIWHMILLYFHQRRLHNLWSLGGWKNQFSDHCLISKQDKYQVMLLHYLFYLQ